MIKICPLHGFIFEANANPWHFDETYAFILGLHENMVKDWACCAHMLVFYVNLCINISKTN